MQLTRIFKYWVLIQIFCFTKAGSKQKWTYEILEIFTETSNPEWVDLNITLERISRGKFGFSGFLEFKTDINDDYNVNCHLKKSQFRTGPYVKVPMSLDNVTFTQAMNKFYKDILMPSVLNCSINAPYIEDKFEAPLTARRIELNKCDISTDNLPSVLMEGYYKLELGLYGENSFNIEALALVENT